MYIINPDGGIPIQVLCDMTTDGGGWAVFQRRLEGSVNFFRGWDSYKNGFGNLNGEFWLGNDNLHRLTAADEVVLRVDLEDFEGDIRYAEYTTFNVSDESEKYRLSVGGYSGTSGDSMSYEGDSYWEAELVNKPFGRLVQRPQLASIRTSAPLEISNKVNAHRKVCRERACLRARCWLDL